jgi:hypothetical protein
MLSLLHSESVNFVFFCLFLIVFDKKKKHPKKYKLDSLKVDDAYKYHKLFPGAGQGTGVMRRYDTTRATTRQNTVTISC